MAEDVNEQPEQDAVEEAPEAAVEEAAEDVAEEETNKYGVTDEELGYRRLGRHPEVL